MPFQACPAVDRVSRLRLGRVGRRTVWVLSFADLLEPEAEFDCNFAARFPGSGRGDDFDRANGRAAFPICGEANVEFLIRDGDWNRLNVGALPALGLLPNVEVLDGMAFHIEGEDALARRFDRLIADRKMQLHGIVAVWQLVGKFGHAEALGPVDRGCLGVFDHQVGPVHLVLINEALCRQPLVSGLVDEHFLKTGRDANGCRRGLGLGNRGRCVGRPQREGGAK